MAANLDLRLHYRTLGALSPDHTNAVLMLHGTTGGGRQFLQPTTADFLFGAGQPLDVGKYFIILPDAIGHGGSSKPSDGLETAFPRYCYADIVGAATSPGDDGARIEAATLSFGHEHGRHADLDVGRALPRNDGRPAADCEPPERVVVETCSGADCSSRSSSLARTSGAAPPASDRQAWVWPGISLS